MVYTFHLKKQIELKQMFSNNIKKHWFWNYINKSLVSNDIFKITNDEMW